MYRFRPEKMAAAARSGFTNATDLADYLVRKGLPFRDAHAVVGRAVLYCLANNLSLEDVDIEKYREFSPLIADDIYKYIAVEECVARRTVAGGPAPETVIRALREAEEWIRGMDGRCIT